MIKRFISGISHKPSIIPGLAAEGLNAIVALAVAVLFVTLISLGDFINLRSLKIQLTVITLGLAFIGLLLSIFDKTPWSLTIAQKVREQYGVEHISLWMTCFRLLLIPACMASCIYGRREVFYLIIMTPLYPACMCILILVGAFILRNRKLGLY